MGCTESRVVAPETVSREVRPALRGNTCGVCFSNTADTVIDPCGHLLLCERCADHVMKHNNKCPICRVNIVKVLRVFPATNLDNEDETRDCGTQVTISPDIQLPAHSLRCKPSSFQYRVRSDKNLAKTM